MDIRNRRAIHQAAQDALANARNPRKIALYYAVGCCLPALVSTIVTAILDNRIDGTGGLGNMGLRSMLTTGRTVLPIVHAVITSCLGLGYHTAILNIVRGSHAEPRTLLDGFRRFGPLLRALLIQFLIYMAIAIASMYVSVSVFMFTPLSNEFVKIMEPLIASGTALNSQLVVDDATMIAASGAAQPLMWIYLAIFALLVIPVYYRYRMAMFSLADSPRKGALAALHHSHIMLRRNRFALFRLDLTMWWYYLLIAMVSVVCYGDMLLPLVGVALPWSDTVSFYLFYGLSLALQTGVYYFAMNRVYAAYAVAYDALQEPPEPKKPKYPFPTQM